MCCPWAASGRGTAIVAARSTQSLASTLSQRAVPHVAGSGFLGPASSNLFLQGASRAAAMVYALKAEPPRPREQPCVERLASC